jgi:hypothetical protein
MLISQRTAPYDLIAVQFSDEVAGLWREIMSRHAETLKEIKLDGMPNSF